MNTQTIHSNLISYHKKDRNYTIFAMLTYAIILGSIVGLLIYSGVGLKVFSNIIGMESGANVPIFVKYIPYFMVGSICFFLLYKLYTISSRETKINQFINKIKNQDTIIHFTERIDYKLYIPLRIINLHLLPIQYAMVQFADKKTFHIPMPENCVQPIKSIASGSNTIGIADTWAELEK